jgi:PAS domain S-box-containing protein
METSHAGACDESRQLWLLGIGPAGCGYEAHPTVHRDQSRWDRERPSTNVGAAESNIAIDRLGFSRCCRCFKFRCPNQAPQSDPDVERWCRMISAKVLVVEDDPIVAHLLQQQLVKFGYEVFGTAASGEQALRQIESSRPDLILMDIRIEGQIDGIETATRILRDHHIPVIYLTSSAAEETLERARDTRPYGYLIKPFYDRELHATIQMAVHRYSGEKALRESEARLDRAQEIAGVGGWELDIASREFIWSRQLYRIAGLSPDAKPTIASMAASIHPDDYPAVPAWLAALQTGPRRDPIELRIKRPDGDERMVRVDGRPLIDADGAVRRLAGSAQDITERRLIERQLVQAQKMEAIGSLTGGMAHDFNNVLGVIIGNLDLLKRLVAIDGEASDLCGEALDGASRCADLIRRLLAFARRQSLHPERTDVNVLVGNIIQLLGRTLGEDITLKLSLDAAVCNVMVDPVQLEAAVINLATNARDAMPVGGRLEITTRTACLEASYAATWPDVAPGDYALIEISDTGTGIPPEIIGRIFEPFFTTKGPGDGSGLGLSMAFGFVKQSGGHLSAYSEPGLGTTFRLYLPRSDTPGVAAVPLAERRPVVGGHETVLVVEDNAQLRQITVRQLTELGYRVLHAERADAALAILAGDDRVDLLFTDVVMPGMMDGVDLAYEATRSRGGLKALLTSGFPGVRGAGQRALDCPFPLLNKPYRHEELAQAIRGILDRRGDLPLATAAGRPAEPGQGIHGGVRAVSMEPV